MIRDLAHVIDSENAKIAEPRRRNDPCPCGSGKRYKHCHGSMVAAADDPAPNDMQIANDDSFKKAENVVTTFEGGPVPISAQRLNIRRGLLRTWIVISAIWILFAGVSSWTQLSEIFAPVETPAGQGAAALSPGPYVCMLGNTPPRQPLRLRVGSNGSNFTGWRLVAVCRLRDAHTLEGAWSARCLAGFRICGRMSDKGV
jgi:SEC-C motif